MDRPTAANECIALELIPCPGNQQNEHSSCWFP